MHFGCNMSAAELAAIMAWLSASISLSCFRRFLSGAKVVIGTWNEVNTFYQTPYKACQEQG